MNTSSRFMLFLLIVNVTVSVSFGLDLLRYWPEFILADIFLFAILYPRIFLIVLRTLPRDLKGVKTLITVDLDCRWEIRKRSTIASIFRRNVQKYKDKIAYIDAETNQSLTFDQLERLSNRVANIFQARGLKKGDVVAIFMNNRIEYVALWLGLSKIGVISALINYNLRHEQLGHCVSTAKAKCLIVGSDLQNVVADAVRNQHISTETQVFVYGGLESRKLSFENLDDLLSKASNAPPLAANDGDFRSVALYIYTSGTTGLPKAAVITNGRYFLLTKGSSRSFDITSKDTVYVCMPLYHSLAGVAGVGQSIISGATVVIRKKFSASRYFIDCANHKCTVGQYIGEICRYLLAQPPKASDQQHCLRIVFGNGLRQQIWTEFMRRFNIKRIGELYASTEGNTSLLNLDNKIGACGFFPIYPFVHLLYPLSLVKVNENTGEIVRNNDGLCIPCRPGEHGEMVGKIIKGNPVKEFHGYLSSNDTNKKLLRNVFSKGDVAFSSGDILFMDEMGYLYFKDRTGDTFRWKGENVSTTEVEGIIHKIIGLNDATVYGVQIPGLEGKAGMAAVVDENHNTNLHEFNEKLKELLPSYSRPVFLRLCKNVEKTGTYKLKKQDLQKDGYDPSKCGDDKLYYLNAKNGEYEPMTLGVYENIVKERISF